MGWSETGADRMCRLRCYVKNNGSGKLIDLVRIRRERILQEEVTGTDGWEARGDRQEAVMEKADKCTEGIRCLCGPHAGIHPE